MSSSSKVKMTVHTGETVEIQENHVLFCRYYVSECTGSEAYRKSISPSASPAAAATGSYKLLQKDEVQKVIEHYKYIACKKLNIAESAVLNELAAVATHNIADCFNVDRSCKHIVDMPVPLQHAIKEFTCEQNKDGNQVFTIKFHDKMNALTQISKIQDFGKINVPNVVINNK